MIVGVSQLISTVLGVGKIALPISGTLGSFVSLIPFAFLSINRTILSFVLIFISILGGFCADYYSKHINLEDPKCIVIDEVCGVWLVLLLCGNWPIDLIAKALEDYNYSRNYAVFLYLFVVFCFFRLFDIWKPFPISFLDSRIKGGFGIMVDDLLAGVFSAICIWLICLFLNFKL